MNLTMKKQQRIRWYQLEKKNILQETHTPKKLIMYHNLSLKDFG